MDELSRNNNDLLEFATACINKIVEWWDKVIFSDENSWVNFFACIINYYLSHFEYLNY